MSAMEVPRHMTPETRGVCVVSLVLLGILCGCSIQSRPDPIGQWGIGGYATANAAVGAAPYAADATAAPLPELAGPSSGKQPAGPPEANAAPWEFEVTPYFWLPSMHGTVGVNGKNARVDLSMSDVLDLVQDTMDWGAAGRMELRKDRWGLLADLSYLTGSDRMEVTGPKGGHLVVRSEYSVAIAELAGAYRVLDRRWTPGAADPPPVWSPQSVDVLAGGRYTRLGGDVNATLTSGQVSFSGGKSQTEEWLDPLVGLQAGWRLLDRLHLNLRGDVGGFGIGSRLAWNLDANLKYQLSKRVELMGGYRVLDYDFRDGGFRFDVRMAGPWLGCGISF